MKFIIDRSKWRCGGIDENIITHEKNFSAMGKGGTALLNEEGYYCCLGLITKQIYPDCNILDLEYPSETDTEYLLTYLDDGLYTNTDLAEEAMYINDNMYLTAEEREQQLTNLFAQHDIELEFTGEYVKYWEQHEDEKV